MDLADLLIRRIEESDIAELYNIERLSFTSPWSFKSLMSELTNPLAVYFAAELEGQVVGYIGMYKILDEGHITNLAVKPAYQLLGIAKRLLNTLCDFAEKNNMSLLTLEVRPSNYPAISLYESFNFKNVGMRKNYYSAPTEDAYIMTREHNLALNSGEV